METLADVPAESLAILAVFVAVYVGMFLGGAPGLALDRTGVALLGAIVLIASGLVDFEAAWDSIDLPTMGLLFGLMVVSAQLRLGGFYARVTRGLVALDAGPAVLLAALIAVSGFLSALLSNDVICLAVAPILVEGCARRRLNPTPFLLALACASNIGSAATIIGNPQNMLIGQALGLSFTGYLGYAIAPSIAGLALTWLIIVASVRGRWAGETPIALPDTSPFNPWQTAKGLVILAGLVVAFAVSTFPRDLLALGAAGILLLSRRLTTRRMLGLIDWHLLVLFAGLFMVNHAMQSTSLVDDALETLKARGVDLEHPGWLFGAAVVLSNLVSNVPATMLLLPAATHPLAGPILALSSTLAGNLIIVGSIANIIVVEQAARAGLGISWREHARIGVPVTLASLAVTALLLALM